jgi:hypothetical protein
MLEDKRLEIKILDLEDSGAINKQAKPVEN